MSLSNLRRQLVALTAFRDAMSELLDEEEEYEPLAADMTRFTDLTLHALAKAEDPDGYVPYPHPHGTFSSWWRPSCETEVVPRSET